MKVLFINTLYTPHVFGGAERVVQSLAESTASLGHQAIVLSLQADRGTRVDHVNGVKVYYVGVKNFYWQFKQSRGTAMFKPAWHVLDTYNPLAARDVTRVLDHERPGLVHTHNLAGFSTVPWQLVRRRGPALVHTLHDYYLLCPRTSMFRDGENCEKQCLRCRPYALPRSHHTKHVDIVTGVSEFLLRRHLDNGLFPSRRGQQVVYNGHGADSRPVRPRGSSLPVRFGYLGRLDPTKGVERLLGSATMLPTETWGVKIGGKGVASYVDRLRSQYPSPAIAFLGYVAADSFLDEIDVLVVPSVWHEPAGKVISEAHAHGVPVIGSTRGGIPELIEEGRTGLLFDPSSRGDLTEKMRRFVDDRSLAESMRPYCVEKAKSLLHENITAQYMQVYEDAAGSA